MASANRSRTATKASSKSRVGRPSVSSAVDVLRRLAGGAGSLRVYDVLVAAAQLHGAKNRGYRSAADPFANFHRARAVRSGRMTPAQYAWTLVDKQDDAADALIHPESAADFKARGDLPALRERLMDGIVYRAIMLGMLP